LFGRPKVLEGGEGNGKRKGKLKLREPDSRKTFVSMFHGPISTWKEVLKSFERNKRMDA